MKMSDVFELPVIDVVHDGYSAEQDRAAAHAINQHDALTQLNEELVEALEFAMCNLDPKVAPLIKRAKELAE